MATKAKSDPTPKSAPASSQPAQSPLADSYAKAVKLVDTGKFAEAVKALTTLQENATTAGDWGMKRRAQIYLTVAEAKAHAPKAQPTDATTEIQACLNRRETDEALKLADKAIKAHPAQGSLHYLRAVAFAQGENAEAAAESLKKAMDLDPDFVYQWHMEADFNAIRKSPLFGFTEGR
jgi:predicted Zn-dependent protease